MKKCVSRVRRRVENTLWAWNIFGMWERWWGKGFRFVYYLSEGWGKKRNGIRKRGGGRKGNLGQKDGVWANGLYSNVRRSIE